MNVLMVEDSEIDAMLVIRELRRGGFNPIWQRVETVEELHTALNSRTWDLIISDYRLPGFNAPMALEIAKQSQKDIPFILVSGTIGEVSAVEMMKAGAHDYVMKDNLSRLLGGGASRTSGCSSAGRAPTSPKSVTNISI
ncbi:response regulator [Nostoc sp. GT001]|uniref:response regulator n=1 Tax=Nostoc sp. GT001 TaxID=3056647 RepID=UPI0025AB257E|nr:response regulator [Nostoc sp. GT001]MDM9584822.1 response regulator [Nostoc sp. GT001]